MLRGDGRRFWARLRAQPVSWDDPLQGTIWTLNDIEDEVAERQALQWAALHDPLTRLANRAALQRRLASIVDNRGQQLPAALLVLDLDRFKPINDGHGHAAGDAMLRAVAGAAGGCIRAGDLLARLGGDEFATVLSACGAEAARHVADAVHEAIGAIRLEHGAATLSVGVSVGLAMLDESMADVTAWLAAADRACYEAKAAGRGRVHQAGAAPLRLVG